ncbi:hypothetical protein CERSUDRAFT_118383 [Gelatoporia subvermispora B]|uniref:Uncharacterized protein n=1 Tax=Ceriporiopsis subvermispora (strain B) TaxID=914234 RepID=M2PBL9_CERS8|nr:hypothetical protein CERSUDRAFT_118383 [Gelatoporia subvermispora B]
MPRREAAEVPAPGVPPRDIITRPRAPQQEHAPFNTQPSLGLGLILDASRRLPPSSSYSDRLRLLAPQLLRINTVPLLNTQVSNPGLEPDSGVFTDVQNFVSSPSDVLSAHPLLHRDSHSSGVTYSQDATSPNIPRWLQTIPGAGTWDDPGYSSEPHTRNTFPPLGSPRRSPARPLRSASLDSGVQNYALGRRRSTLASTYTPPPPPRPRILTLPPSSRADPEYFLDNADPNPSESRSSPWQVDLHEHFDVRRLQLCADAAAEAVRRASETLCACALLRNPESIALTCEALRSALTAVDTALEDTPPRLELDDPDYGRQWHSKHLLLILSVERHLGHISQLADQIARRPPRIHRLHGIVEKFNAYEAKFADLARRLALSHERLRIRVLKNILEEETGRATALVEAERVRRREFKELWHESREKRRELRSLIRIRQHEAASIARSFVTGERSPSVEHEENVPVANIDRNG